MRVEIETRGSAELIKALHALEASMTREVQVTALVVGAEPMRQHAASLAPRSPKRTPHLADEIVISVPSEAKLERRGQFDVVVEMGPAKRPHDHFYSYFQEYGTIRHRAQPFMRPAFDAQAHRSLDLVLQTLWVVIQRIAEKNKAA
jgi:HK97 gp10 family phage protein